MSKDLKNKDKEAKSRLSLFEYLKALETELRDDSYHGDITIFGDPVTIDSIVKRVNENIDKARATKGLLSGYRCIDRERGYYAIVGDESELIANKEARAKQYDLDNDAAQYERKPDEHYKQKRFEPIEVIDEYELGFNLGNALKYILRAKFKGSELDDLRKAKNYIDYELKKLTNEKI